jgi:hypothetical protein
LRAERGNPWWIAASLALINDGKDPAVKKFHASI